jgi:MFS family permease
MEGPAAEAERHLQRARRRAVGSLFSSVGLGATGFLAALAVAPLVAEDMLGSATWSGVPAATTVAGTAAGTTLLSILMARKGRRLGLIFGYGLAAAAAGIAAAAAALSWFPLFLVGMLLFGAGYGSSHLARYAAATLYLASQRASAIGWIVWAGTIGAVFGPTLLEPARSVGQWLGSPGLAGPYLMAAVCLGAAGLVLFFVLQPGWLPEAPGTQAGERPKLRSLSSLLSLPRVEIALIAMVVGHVVMVLIMTMTPIHIRNAGAGLGSVGLVISAHTLGMFALSPLSGMLSDRLGRIPMILAGETVLIGSALLASFAPGGQQGSLVLALFLLGVGWNFGFVAGSALLTDSVTGGDRLRLQGVADSMVWISGATASLASGLLLSSWGFAALGLLSALLALHPRPGRGSLPSEPQGGLTIGGSRLPPTGNSWRTSQSARLCNLPLLSDV